MEDEVRELLAEATGEDRKRPCKDSDKDVGDDDDESSDEFHDTSDLTDNDLTRPSDWTPGQGSGKMIKHCHIPGGFLAHDLHCYILWYCWEIN